MYLLVTYKKSKKNTKNAKTLISRKARVRSTLDPKIEFYAKYQGRPVKQKLQPEL